MFFLSTPIEDEIQRILSEVSARPYNYEHVGATDGELRVAPPGYRLSRYGTPLGVGEAVFETACASLAKFGNYPPSFARVVSLATSIEEGVTFGTLATHFGFASLHPCRIVRVERDASARRFGFSLGTLPGHIGAGEERFVLTLNDDGVVRYDVQAISRPDGLIGRLGTPLFRMFQKRFERETLETMRSHCEGNVSRSIRE